VLHAAHRSRAMAAATAPLAGEPHHDRAILDA
jgi:hypothetical protein